MTHKFSVQQGKEIEIMCQNIVFLATKKVWSFSAINSMTFSTVSFILLLSEGIFSCCAGTLFFLELIACIHACIYDTSLCITLLQVFHIRFVVFNFPVLILPRENICFANFTSCLFAPFCLWCEIYSHSCHKDNNKQVFILYCSFYRF